VEGLLHAINIGNWSFVQSADLPLSRHSPSPSASPSPSPSSPQLNESDFLSVVLSSDVIEHPSDSIFDSKSTSSTSAFLSLSSNSVHSNSSNSSSLAVKTQEGEEDIVIDENQESIQRKIGRRGVEKVMADIFIVD
jgi:hypothetical protein